MGSISTLGFVQNNVYYVTCEHSYEKIPNWRVSWGFFKMCLQSVWIIEAIFYSMWSNHNWENELEKIVSKKAVGWCPTWPQQCQWNIATL